MEEYGNIKVRYLRHPKRPSRTRARLRFLSNESSLANEYILLQMIRSNILNHFAKS